MYPGWWYPIGNDGILSFGPKNARPKVATPITAWVFWTVFEDVVIAWFTIRSRVINPESICVLNKSLVFSENEVRDPNVIIWILLKKI